MFNHSQRKQIFAKRTFVLPLSLFLARSFVRVAPQKENASPPRPIYFRWSFGVLRRSLYGTPNFPRVLILFLKAAAKARSGVNTLLAFSRENRISYAIFFSRPLALKYRVSSRRVSMYICAPVSDRTGACLRAKREVARRGCEILKGSKKRKSGKCAESAGVWRIDFFAYRPASAR